MKKGEHQTNPNSLANLRPPWQPGQSGNPKGRPKNLAKVIYAKVFGKKSLKKLHNLNSVEVDDWDNFILSASVADLQILVKNDDVPAYPRSLIMSVLTEMKNGQCKTIEKLRDRQHGKAIKHEITGANGEALIPTRNLTPQEAKEFLIDLEKNV